MVSLVRYNSNKTFNEFCTMGDVGPSANGWPIGKRDKVSFTAGTRERKTVAMNKIPAGAELMNQMFREADVHIWLAPLYHGSIPGVMKNCLDWLELSAREAVPYLTGKTIGLVCWADGVQAMQGINAMDAVAKALRAWTLPYSLPIQRPELFDEQGTLSAKYVQRFDLLLQLLVQGKPLPVVG